MTTRMTSKNTPCGLNRDVIKMIAMGTMLLNHVATVFMEPGTFLFELFVDIGYFTAITMCYFLVEGWHYTRSRRRYALRLFLFALLSQIPFSYAFSEDGSLRYSNLNMMFTLLFCFLIIWALKEIPDPGKSRAMAFFLTCCTAFCDWAFFAAVFTWLFVWACRKGRRLPGDGRCYASADLRFFPASGDSRRQGCCSMQRAPQPEWLYLPSASCICIMESGRREGGSSFSGSSTCSIRYICLCWGCCVLRCKTFFSHKDQV